MEGPVYAIISPRFSALHTLSLLPKDKIFLRNLMDFSLLVSDVH